MALDCDWPARPPATTKRRRKKSFFIWIIINGPDERHKCTASVDFNKLQFPHQVQTITQRQHYFFHGTAFQNMIVESLYGNRIFAFDFLFQNLTVKERVVR